MQDKELWGRSDFLYINPIPLPSSIFIEKILPVLMKGKKPYALKKSPLPQS
jgi:hypothetical protein